MLIKPIQRLCKYPLFFRTLTEAAPTDELTKASALIDALAQTVNSTVKAAKARSRMATLLQRLGSDGEESFLSLLAPHRELLLEARVRFCEVALRADGGVSKRRRSSQPVGASASGKLLLFSDCLLLAHKPAAGPAAWAMAHFDAAPRSGELNSGELSTVSASTPVSGPRNRLVARALVLCARFGSLRSRRAPTGVRRREAAAARRRLLGRVLRHGDWTHARVGAAGSDARSRRASRC